MRVMEWIKIGGEEIGREKKEKWKFRKVEVVNVVVVLGLLVVRNG